ncbi:T9SS type A sorting domain-containing protein [Flavivirga algicola]|uniref:T9SS type A sorting domain-containing protein n=1 Tax=Flavivirga algicola TaxID=2729136 RepID=A0ABX1S2B0_9FLAO|nr:T9SS type A sorting domain-containing protein [Flavivirga algicola]NMH89390.1 T9SS type A sorting domain-containing protein [Flavivirga algicola]
MSYLREYFLVCLISCFFTSFLVAQTTRVPDSNFENYLETHDASGNLVNIGDPSSMGDGIANNEFVLNANIQDVTSLNVSYQNISDLTGIAGFTNLETLICSNNDLTTLNVSALTNLKSLLCGLNQLTDLDVQSNNALEVLDCSSNQLTQLILQQGNTANNPLLRRLTCSNNRLSNLDVSQNNALTFLAVSENQLSGELNVGSNTNLESLFCTSNQIDLLNLTSNTLLKTIDVSNNLITSLDLSSINTVACPNPQSDPPTVCQGTASINVSNNRLTSLNIGNGFNGLISTFNSEDNQDLYCIQIDNGFTPPLPMAWTKDDWTYYGEMVCTDIFTFVPDDNFENYLETHDAVGGNVAVGDPNSMGDGVAGNNFVLTERIETVLSLNIQNSSIEDLTGVEDFMALRTLDCSSNQITHLNLTANTNLTTLNCSDNILPPIDLSNNLLLTTLDCSSQTPYVDLQDASNNHSFDVLNITANVALLSLNCSNNVLSALDISTNTLLTDVDCSFNQIENLDATTNANLLSILCNDNRLLSLNVKNTTNTTNLSSFNATNNADLVCIEVDNITYSDTELDWYKDGTASYSLGCGTYVPDNNFENYLETHQVDLTVVPLGDPNSMGDGVMNNFVPSNKINAVLRLEVQRLNITDLTGLEDFDALQELNCANNALTSLNVTANTLLQILDCSSNQIENLDLSLNTVLNSLLCNNNALFTLDIKNGNNSNQNVFEALNNPSLFCINVDDNMIGNIPGNWEKDLTADYSADCDGSRFTDIPDVFFEQALIDLGLDSGPLDNRVLTANIEHVLTLNVTDRQIQNLEGIKGFSLLRELDCSNNYLDSLDVSDMTYLEELYCSSNYFLTNNISNTNGLLNTTGTTNLKILFCSGNNLADLDTSLNLNLEELDCADNKITNLLITGNTLLKELNCSNNNLVDLDISSNLAIEDVNCNSNSISNLVTSNVNNTTLTHLSCSNNQLVTLLIDDYVSLVDLNCGSNALQQLNTTSNTLLEVLDFTNNQIAGIDISLNASLIKLFGAQNQLTQLTVPASSPIEHINCDNNQINQITVNTAAFLIYLSCTNNQLTSLDLSNNLNLIELNVSSNNLSDLTLSNDLNQLKTFNCSNNVLIGGLDLSTMGTGACPPIDPNKPEEVCPSTITINVSNNLLEFLNVQNGANNDILNFNANINSDLSCIQVDDVNNIPANWQKDTASQYSIDCRFGETYVPDDNFEQALILLGYDSGPLNDYVPTVNIEARTVLDLSGDNISDLTGIEDFKALQNLNISSNALTTLDLSKNTALTDLDVSNNGLSDLDVSNNTALITINGSGNTLTELNLTANTNVTNLNIANNNFSEFTPSSIASLQLLNCDGNQLVDLDLSMNIALTSLNCASNLLERLNIKNGQNPNLASLNTQNNLDLTCIETDTGTVPAGVTWVKDATTEYAIDCHYGETYVPDDAFETALINFGYDSGALDDYVPTSSINGISFLDVSGLGIADLTGIEDFINLSILNFKDNTVANVDLSKNVLLQNLNASNNTLTSLDVSFHSNLIQLNVSNNALTQINLNTNSRLVELNISSNMLTTLDVDALTDIERLNCSSNELDALSVTANPNLIELLCASNLFIQDRLNIQNGANENLGTFNATDNPDLRCILVDNPFEVVTNTNGTYDNWFKDISASYQSICEDADNDGVTNTDDMCPNTPFGAPVDLFGCPFLSLPDDNFTVLITDETCLNNNNGKINITTKELHNYKANLSNDDFNKDYNFTNEIDILNLLAGTYRLCITLDEWPDYLRCYDVVINHPDHLEVITGKQTNSKKVSFAMSGSSNYHIEFNGFSFTTNDSELTLSLEKGANTVKITTDLECQGVYEETILNIDEPFVSPNPFQNHVNVYLGNERAGSININVYSYLGQLIYSKTVTDKDNRTNLNIDTNTFASGLYTLFVESNTSLSTFKIVKK